MNKAIESKIVQILDDYVIGQDSFSVEIDNYDKWHYSLDDLEIKFYNNTSETIYNMVPIGTFSKEYDTFLWSWENEDLDEKTKNEAVKLKEIYKEFPFKAFQVESFKCEAEELDEICAIARYFFNGKAIFKVKDESPWLYMVVRDK